METDGKDITPKNNTTSKAHNNRLSERNKAMWFNTQIHTKETFNSSISGWIIKKPDRLSYY